MNRARFVVVALVVLSGLVACGARPDDAAQLFAEVPIDAAGISGVVLNGDRPEAGVWVVAETDSLATHYQRIVVTDDEGRFLVPDLPDADYEVWVRGYGLRGLVAGCGRSRRAAHAGGRRRPNRTGSGEDLPGELLLSLYEPPPDNALPLVGNALPGRRRGTSARERPRTGTGTRRAARPPGHTRLRTTGSVR